MDKTKTRSTIGMTLAMAFSGSIGVIVIESGQAAIDVVFFRCLFGCLALAIYLMVTAKLRFVNEFKKSIGWMIFSGITMTLNWVFFFKAYHYASISSVTIVYHVYPFVLLIGASLFFGESIVLRSYVCAAIAFLGVFCVVASSGEGNRMSMAGFIYTIAAMFFYTITLMTAKKIKDVPAVLLSLVQLAVGTFVLLFLIDAGNINNYSFSTWGYLVSLGLIHTALLYVLLYQAVQILNATTFSLLSFLYPLTALLLDIAVYNVEPTSVQLLGMCLIVAGVLAEKIDMQLLTMIRIKK